MIHLESDYNNGAHTAVLKHLAETNDERTDSYGDDCFSNQARTLIREACQAPNAQIWFLVGGTQTNATIINAVLQPYEGVICCESAHINVHEAGAVESTGHKVIALPARQGRLDAEELRRWLAAFFADDTAEHMVRPGMVYITFPTELGTLYTAQQLNDLHTVCKDYGLPLFVDGARLAYGLAATNSVTMPLLSQLADVFTIGGTKCGALCGEAVVFSRGQAPHHMLSRIKRQGALLAKSRLVGVQFEALFTADHTGTPLYLSIGRHTVKLAMRLRDLLEHRAGYKPYIDSPTNQQFFVIPNSRIELLRCHVGFEVWGPADNEHTVCRFVTSWATTDEEMNLLSGVEI